VTRIRALPIQLKAIMLERATWINVCCMPGGDQLSAYLAKE
jgi:hypothetical protein